MMSIDFGSVIVPNIASSSARNKPMVLKNQHTARPNRLETSSLLNANMINAIPKHIKAVNKLKICITAIPFPLTSGSETI